LDQISIKILSERMKLWISLKMQKIQNRPFHKCLFYLHTLLAITTTNKHWTKLEVC
jgi:hypothetical protein